MRGWKPKKLKTFIADMHSVERAFHAVRPWPTLVKSTSPRIWLVRKPSMSASMSEDSLDRKASSSSSVLMSSSSTSRRTTCSQQVHGPQTAMRTKSCTRRCPLPHCVLAMRQCAAASASAAADPAVAAAIAAAAALAAGPTAASLRIWSGCLFSIVGHLFCSCQHRQKSASAAHLGADVGVPRGSGGHRGAYGRRRRDRREWACIQQGHRRSRWHCLRVMFARITG